MLNSKDFNHFEYNPVDIDMRRSVFNLNHSVKWSANLGEVIPFECIECNPGETFIIDTSKVVRLQPLVAPIYDEIICDVHWFFVPHRLVWNHWTNFCGENDSSAWAPTTEYHVPMISAPLNMETNESGWKEGTIADYLGVPPNQFCLVSALPFRSYALICDQWYRSESVMNPVHCFVDDQGRHGSNGDDQVNDIELGGKPFIACKLADYFTTALPAPQRGQASSVFPAGSYAPVVSVSEGWQDQFGIRHPYRADDRIGSYLGPVTVGYYKDSKWHNFAEDRFLGVDSTNDSRLSSHISSTTFGSNPTAFNNLFSDLSINFNINDLRQAFAVQRYLEKSARYGGRYIEFIKGFFGIDSPDARLQRTEYLGGSRFVLNINQVTQQSPTVEGSTPLGNVAGNSVTADIHHDVNYSTTEHGYIIGCCVLRHHPSYQQGLQRMFMRENFTDFYLPTFAHLGEQEVSSQELFATNSLDDFVFGYQERYAEYRYLPNRIAGELRSSAETSLDMWHLADYYASAPHLSPDWLREDKSVLDRCLAVTSDVSDQALFDFYLEIKATRPMPLYGVPGLIDHY